MTPPLPAWRDASSRQRAHLVVLYVIAWGVGFPLMLVAAMSVIGMSVEGYGEHLEQVARCQKQAVTPAEYHRCR